MSEEQKQLKLPPNDPRMPLPARKTLSSKLPAGLDRITIMMGVLFLFGVVWVLWASQATTPQSASAAEADNSVIVKAGLMDMKLLALGTGDRKDITADFYSEIKDRQIPVADLKVNPFVTFGCESHAETVERQEAVAKAKENEKEVAANVPADIKAPPVEKLKLQSVMVMGNMSSATISGALVSKGQVIGGLASG